MDDTYERGNNWLIDDRSGFRIRRREARQEWNGAIVHMDDWEPRHPQDFVKGRRDDQRVPAPRPDSVPTYYGPLTGRVTADATASATSLTVDESARFRPGDIVGVYSSGDLVRLTVDTIVDEFTISFTTILGGPVQAGTLITNFSAVSQPNIG